MIPAAFVGLDNGTITTVTDFFHVGPSRVLITRSRLSLPPNITGFGLNNNRNNRGKLGSVVDGLNGGPGFRHLHVKVNRPNSGGGIINFILNGPPIDRRGLVSRTVSRTTHYARV